jgi:hypothetical protein
MGEAKRRTQLDPNYRKKSLIYEIAKTLSSFLAANTLQTAVAAFTI